MENIPTSAYNLHQTMAVLARGSADPSLRFTAEGLWWCIRTPAGTPVTIWVQQQGNKVRAKLWGEVGADFSSQLWRMLGLEDDWSDFDDPAFLASLPPLIRQSRRAHPGARQPHTGLLLDQLITVVLEQKVTHEEARFAWRYLLRAAGETPPGPAPAGMKVPPSPAQWAAIPDWHWHQARVDSHRKRTIQYLVSRAGALRRLALLPRQELRHKLLLLPGIGPWTVAEVVQRTHADPDTISVGDYHLAHHVVEALTGVRGNDTDMIRVLLPWAGQRHRVVRMMRLSNFRPSRFGPKLSPEDHRTR